MRWLAVWIVLWASPVMAQNPAAPTQSDPRLRVVSFDAGQVVRLRVATGYQTTVLFGSDESVESVGIGDGEAWQVTPNASNDALFIKPLRSNSTTNMTVITTARVYSFELSAAYSPAPDTPYTVRFLYPGAYQTDRHQAMLQRPGPHYRMSGARQLRPQSIRDDGSRTYIEWGDAQELPAIFALDDRGEQGLVTGHVRDGLYVIDAVHGTLLFRLGRQTARATRERPRSAE